MFLSGLHANFQDVYKRHDLRSICDQCEPLGLDIVQRFPPVWPRSDFRIRAWAEQRKNGIPQDFGE
jgi:hypothetical protein